MGYRDNLSAVLARSAALDRELASARDEIRELRKSLETTDPTRHFESLPDVKAGDFAVSDDDRILADTMVSKALGYDPAAYAWEQEPSPPPRSDHSTERDAGFAEGRELGREEGAVAAYRYALHQLLERRVGYLSPKIEQRVLRCTDAGQLLTWIVLVGTVPESEIEPALGG